MQQGNSTTLNNITVTLTGLVDLTVSGDLHATRAEGREGWFGTMSVTKTDPASFVAMVPAGSLSEPGGSDVLEKVVAVAPVSAEELSERQKRKDDISEFAFKFLSIKSSLVANNVMRGSRFGFCSSMEDDAGNLEALLQGCVEKWWIPEAAVQAWKSYGTFKCAVKLFDLVEVRVGMNTDVFLEYVGLLSRTGYISAAWYLVENYKNSPSLSRQLENR